MFVVKIEQLSKSFSHLRRTRGDGNCFYRAFIFSYLEGLLLQGDMTECNRCERKEGFDKGGAGGPAPARGHGRMQQV